jgi:hypothetical protein
METACSSATSADFQRPIRRYIPKDKTLQTPNAVHYLIRITLSLLGTDILLTGMLYSFCYFCSFLQARGHVSHNQMTSLDIQEYSRD